MTYCEQLTYRPQDTPDPHAPAEPGSRPRVGRPTVEDTAHILIKAHSTDHIFLYPRAGRESVGMKPCQSRRDCTLSFGLMFCSLYSLNSSSPTPARSPCRSDLLKRHSDVDVDGTRG